MATFSGLGKLPQRGGNVDQSREDVKRIIYLQGISAVLHRDTETYGSSGEVLDASSKYYKIYMIIHEGTRRNRQHNQVGKQIQGEFEAYFPHYFPPEVTEDGYNEGVTVQEGDRIRDQDNNYWRVEEVVSKQELEGKEIFRKCRLFRIEKRR